MLTQFVGYGKMVPDTTKQGIDLSGNMSASTCTTQDWEVRKHEEKLIS